MDVKLDFLKDKGVEQGLIARPVHHCDGPCFLYVFLTLNSTGTVRFHHGHPKEQLAACFHLCIFRVLAEACIFLLLCLFLTVIDITTVYLFFVKKKISNCCLYFNRCIHHLYNITSLSPLSLSLSLSPLPNQHG